MGVLEREEQPAAPPHQALKLRDHHSQGLCAELLGRKIRREAAIPRKPQQALKHGRGGRGIVHPFGKQGTELAMSRLFVIVAGEFRRPLDLDRERMKRALSMKWGALEFDARVQLVRKFGP